MKAFRNDKQNRAGEKVEITHELELMKAPDVQSKQIEVAENELFTSSKMQPILVEGFQKRRITSKRDSSKNGFTKCSIKHLSTDLQCIIFWKVNTILKCVQRIQYQLETIPQKSVTKQCHEKSARK